MIDALLTAEWLTQLQSCPRLWLGFSGGLDSCVLLHMLAAVPQLKNKIIAVHINHGLSPNADTWQMHAKMFCDNLGVSFSAYQVNFLRQANLEEAAREARYAVFSDLIQNDDALLLAHHQNDQAETLLLHLCRGAGINGLSAMAASQPFAKGTLCRPLLNYSRKQLEAHARLHQLSWIEDESNQDIRFSRNFIRQQVIPLLEQKWPMLSSTLSRTAVHCAAAQENLNDLALMDCPELLLNGVKHLLLTPLKVLPVRRLINVLRLWFKKNQVRQPSSIISHKIITQLIKAKEDAEPCIQWGEHQLRRYREHLYLLPLQNNVSLENRIWPSFPQPLDLGNLQGMLQPLISQTGVYIPKGSEVEVRFRQGGEEILLQGQTKSVKKLLQQWGVLPWLRDSIPLIYINQQLAAIVNYAISDDFYRKNHVDCYTFTLIDQRDY